MSISDRSRDALKNLAIKMVEETQEATLADISLTKGIKQGPFPEPLREAAGEETLLLSGDDLRSYSAALVSLGREKEMEHLSVRDIDDELWDFVCELFVHRKNYGEEGYRRKAIRELVSRLGKPWQYYEVIAVLDNVKLTVRTLTSMGVHFRHLTRESASKWGLMGSARLDKYAKEFMGRTVAIATERAGSPKRAAERAIDNIDDALHGLRAALVGSIKANILDEQMLFKRGMMLVVKQVATNEIGLVQWHRPFQPLEFEVRRATAEPVRNYLASINAIIEGEFRESIRNRLRRALHWIGSSITRESYDDKVVDLCTALEALLTLRSDRRKGEAIALRSMLLPSALGEGFSNPFTVYELYDLRSRIIHGSDLRVCGRRDYSHLLWLATVVVSQFVALVSRDGSITTATKMIDTIEASELISGAISWLKASDGKASREIAEFAHLRLKEANARCC